jgi:nucleotide-binding universal stress UspA family protein
MLNILVPNDYSPEAKNALRYAVEFAAQTNSQIFLYHAIPEVMPLHEVPYENYYADELEEEQLLLDSYKNMADEENWPKIKIPKTLVNFSNRVTDGIIAAVEEFKADLVIMGTHGASGWRKYILGTNTSNLIAESNFPILVIPAQYKFTPIYHIVYSSDLRNLEIELNLMVPFSKIFQAVLDIFYFDYAGAESEKSMLDAEQYIRSLNYQNIKLTVKKGNLELSIDEQLNNQIDTSNTQIITLFRNIHSWMDELLLSSNSRKMAMNSQIPVLIFKKPTSN